jgi:hypothetical protein
LVIKTLNSELDPDPNPHLGKMLDPDPDFINADPQPCLTLPEKVKIPFIELVLSLAGLAGRLDVHECDGDGGADVPAPGQAAHALYRSISEMNKKKNYR